MGVPGSDQQSLHRAASRCHSKASGKQPQMSLACLAPPVLPGRSETWGLNQEALLPQFRRPLWGQSSWEQLDKGKEEGPSS